MSKLTREGLEQLSGPELVETYNELNPTTPVNKFSSKSNGIDRILESQMVQSGSAVETALYGDVQPQTISDIWSGVAPPPVALVEGPPSGMKPNSQERNLWVATDATSTKFLTNRKEVVLFNAKNPRGLVQTIIREEYELDAEETIAFNFFDREGAKVSWPKTEDVNRHRATLVKVLIRNGQSK